MTGGASTAARRAGHALGGVVTAFLAFDVAGKLLQPAPVLEGTRQLGWPVETLGGLGITLLACTALYVIPRTAVLGAILLTGYLGGAVATHVRVLDPIASHVLFPVYAGAFVWGSLVLREARLRALFPLRAPPPRSRS